VAPDRAEPLFARARALDDAGRNEQAKQAYLEVLQVEPEHFEALTSLGALANKMGLRSAARAALTRATQSHPHRALGHANLGILLSDAGELPAAREHLETALRLEPGSRVAHRGMAILLLRLGETEAAARHGRTGFGGKADPWPFRGQGRPVSVLLLLSALGPNAPVEIFMDDRVFQKWTLAPEFFDPQAELPPHDVVFNGIGDADRCGAALDAAGAILARISAPILNAPARVRDTGRVANALRLARIPGVVTPGVSLQSRASLTAEDVDDASARARVGWPLLLRSPGFHGGDHFVKVDRWEDFRAAVAGLPGDSLFVMQFVDTRGADGKFRKYRVMMVDGRLYPLHLAVSNDWKVHYFTADMADRPDHRAEDEAFLQDMPGVLGPRAMQALEHVREAMGLDYGGIDFGLDGQGNVVVFEANAAMVVSPPRDGDPWKYRVAPVARVGQAVQAMLLRAAGRATVDIG
jgi:hypothetical protein